MPALSISFKGALIRYMDVRQGKEGGDLFARIYMSSEWTDAVAKRMGWGEPSEGLTGGRLTGALLGQNMTLAPRDSNLANQTISFDIKQVSGFEVAIVQDGDKTPTKEIRFMITSGDTSAVKAVERYMRAMGKHPGTLKVAYSKQEELELEPNAAAGAGEGESAE